MKYSEGKFDTSLHLRTQVDQLTGRNEELRHEMKSAREEAANTLNQLTKANEKVQLADNPAQSASKIFSLFSDDSVLCRLRAWKVKSSR